MSKTTYGQMPALLRAKKEFEGNSVSARWVYNHDKSEKAYVIYSYSTVMYYEYENGNVEFNDRYYSNTTNRIQSMLRRVMPPLTDYEKSFELGKRGGKHYLRKVAFKKGGVWSYEQY